MLQSKEERKRLATKHEWDVYFAEGGGWEVNNGREQTRLFAKAFCAHTQLRMKPGYTLLDSSCGLGDALPVLSKRFPGIRLYGCDFSTEAIRRAESRFSGVASFSAMLYYLYAKARLDEIQPKLVVVFLDANDPADDYMTLHTLHQGQFERRPVFNEAGELIAVQPLHGGDQLKGKAKDQAKEAAEKYARKLRAARPVRAFLRRNSALFRLITGDFDAQPKLSPDKLGDPLVDRYGHYRPMNGQDWRPLYRVSLRYLVKLRDLLTAHGVKLAVVTYPYAVAISPDEWDVGRTRWLFEVGKVYHTDFFDFFDKELKAKGIPHLSLLEYLRSYKEQHSDERIYFRWDGHFNPAGNKLVAERVYRWLTKEGLVPTGETDAAGYK